MKSAIEEICYGAFAQSKKMWLSPKQQKLLDTVIECDEKLTERFKDNQEVLSLFKNFKNALDEHSATEAFIFYKEGFRNGFQIALDAMDDE